MEISVVEQAEIRLRHVSGKLLFEARCPVCSSHYSIGATVETVEEMAAEPQSGFGFTVLSAICPDCRALTWQVYSGDEVREVALHVKTHQDAPGTPPEPETGEIPS